MAVTGVSFTDLRLFWHEPAGFSERVVHNLTEELVRLGHEVTLYASGDNCADMLAPHFTLIEMVEREASNFEIIHSHIVIYKDHGDIPPTVSAFRLKIKMLRSK